MRTSRKITIAAAAVLATMTTAGALAEPRLAGDTITANTLVDHTELVRVADALDAAVDAKDRTLARSLFTDTIDVDFTSLAGGEPATIPADGLIGGWSSNLDGGEDLLPSARQSSGHLRRPGQCRHAEPRLCMEPPRTGGRLPKTAAKDSGRSGAPTSTASCVCRMAGGSTA